MENNFTMEVLLMTNTRFSKREHVDQNVTHFKLYPRQNKLANACWNGMVPVMLPELFKDTDCKEFMMWQLEEGRQCLYMQIGQQPLMPEPHFGLHPWLLLENTGQN